MNYSVSIDVPQLDDGLRFYRDALGLAEIARPVPTYVILRCGDSQIGLMEKRAGTRPAPGADDALARGLRAGAGEDGKRHGGHAALRRGGRAARLAGACVDDRR